jgi:hypothetical protein
MSYRGVIEKVQDGQIRRILMVAAQDFLMSEAAKNNTNPKTLKAREYLTNAEFHSERLALLAIVHDQSLDDNSPDSRFLKAIEDVFDILLKG